MDNVNKKYDQWCEKIAQELDAAELITHFREHVGEHYGRYDRADQASMDVWMAGVMNFMNIFKKKFPHITTEDMLFKLCAHYNSHGNAVDPPFELGDFLEEYKGAMKKFCEKG